MSSTDPLEPSSGAPARPRCLVNCAISLDGKLNPSPDRRTGPFQMSRYPEDVRRMVALRARVGAIVIGAGNLRADDPDLALAPDERDRRRTRGEPDPLRVVLTRHGEGLRPGLRVFERSLGGETIVAHARSLPEDARKRLSGVSTLVAMGDETVDIGILLAWLAHRGVSTVLCEGGGDINAAFFAARAVDELHLTICPRILGGVAAPTLVAGPGFSPDALPDATLASLERVGNELFARYDFAWSNVGGPLHQT